MTSSGGMVARLRERAECYRLGGPSAEHTASILDEAAALIASQAADLAERAKEVLAAQAQADENYQRALAAEAALGNLLAIIHRDSGEHAAAHGLHKSVEAAHLVWAGLITAAEAAEAALAKAVEALTKITEHPESMASETRSYGPGWAFWNVQGIARVALTTTKEPHNAG